MKIHVTPAETRVSKGVSWDVNWSMKIPPQMCKPYAADFDGDEMTLFVVKRESSIKECKSFMWRYNEIEITLVEISVNSWK